MSLAGRGNLLNLPVVPANFEYDIDHRLIDMAAWDHVSIDDLVDCFRRLNALPGDLSDTVEYLDLGEASFLSVSHQGALQLATEYEALLERGLRGIVIYAPGDNTNATVRMIMTTLAGIVGELPAGFRLVRTPVSHAKLREFLATTSPDQAALSS